MNFEDKLNYCLPKRAHYVVEPLKPRDVVPINILGGSTFSKRSNALRDAVFICFFHLGLNWYHYPYVIFGSISLRPSVYG